MLFRSDFTGRVAAITQASAQSFSAIPQQNLSGNYTKVTQLQPVKNQLGQLSSGGRKLAISGLGDISIVGKYKLWGSCDNDTRPTEAGCPTRSDADPPVLTAGSIRS